MPVKSKVLCAAGFALVTTILLSTACSPESNDTQTLSVAVAPTSVNIAAGGSGTATATITRGGGFNGAAALTATGAPTGVTVAFAPASIATGATTSQVNVSVDAAVAPGTSTIVIHAAGTGVTTATANLSVVVLSAESGGFAIAAAPATLNSTAGAAAQTSTINITRTAPFDGAVAFTVTGAPAGMTTSFSPQSATGASTTLSVTTATSTVNGTYPLVVRGTGTGVADATTNVSVVVTGGASAGVTLALAPANLSLTAGAAASTSTLTITRTGGFTDAVGVAVTGMPTGMTAVPNPTSIASGSTTSTITVGTAATTAPGTYNLIVTASGTGIANATATLPVTVTTASGGGSVTVSFCAEDAPIWVAIQDGGGAWTRVNPTAGSSYTFSFPSGKGGIATVDTVGTGFETDVVYASLAEFTNYGGTVNFQCGEDKTLNGTVSNLAATSGAFVSMGFGFGFVQPGFTTYTLNGVASGPQDLVATRRDATTAVTGILVQRGLNIADNGTIPNLDFATATAPGTENVTVTNNGADNTNVAALFYGNRGSSFAPIGSIDTYTSGALPIAVMPVSLLQASETQLLLVSASATNSDRTSGVFFRTPANVSVALGPVLSAPTVTKAATAPYVRPQAALAGQAEYNRYVSADFQATGADIDMSVLQTAGYLGAAPANWTLTFPDLSGASGWDNAWAIANGTPFSWTIDAQGGAIPFLDTGVTDGTTTKSASQSSSSDVTLRAQRSGTTAGPLQQRMLRALKGLNPR